MPPSSHAAKDSPALPHQSFQPPLHIHLTLQVPAPPPSTPTAKMITGIHHINLVVPPSTLPLATAFYATTLGLTPRPVPAAQLATLAWFDIGDSGQQVHIAFGKPHDFVEQSSRHPCFKVGSIEALNQLRERIWAHFERGGDGAPVAADRPGEEDSGAKGVEYPTRFFARDYAGNRLEFTL